MSDLQFPNFGSSHSSSARARSVMSLLLAGLSMAAGCADDGSIATTSRESAPSSDDSRLEETAPAEERVTLPYRGEPAPELVEDGGVATDDAALPAVDAALAPDAAEGCGVWYADCDGDGYAASGANSVQSCETPAAVEGCVGWTQRAPELGAIDCEDSSAAHHPGASLGLAISSANAGLAALLCRPDGTYVRDPSLRCVVTSNPDLDCDGELTPDPAGATFCISGGHCIASLTHECASGSDCSCWSTPTPPCGLVQNLSANLCPTNQGFTGDTALLCR